MTDHSGFYTLKGYADASETELTSSMEDYLEMIYRLHITNDIVRTGDIAEMLHVKPSSATKMVQSLNSLGFLNSAKYGFVFLTEKGEKKGRYLLYRHNVLNKFLSTLNGTKNELEQAEKIEHFLNVKTVKNLDKLTKELLSKPQNGK